MHRKMEIESFNELKAELPELLSLDTAQLDAVLGGLSRPPDCTNYVVCSAYCGTLELGGDTR